MAQREASEEPVKSKGGSTEGVSSFVEGAPTKSFVKAPTVPGNPRILAVNHMPKLSH